MRKKHHTPLDKYFNNPNCLPPWFIAEKADIAGPYLSQIRHGVRRPSPEVALKLFVALQGAVGFFELIFPHRHLEVTKILSITA